MLLIKHLGECINEPPCVYRQSARERVDSGHRQGQARIETAKINGGIILRMTDCGHRIDNGKPASTLGQRTGDSISLDSYLSIQG